MVAEPRNRVQHNECLVQARRFPVPWFQPSTGLGIHGRGPVWALFIEMALSRCAGLSLMTCLALSKAMASLSTVPNRATSHTLTLVISDARVLWIFLMSFL